ncbi:unnamed protein product [Symbiodinium necroappetens]|uniref:Uncharacterized protein n=1 Tax=Symbiodinium necroappetens TaxID=1628268 RepID=A0A813CLA9_9DINO|nr:unnamed protein product [Symbiodinium necroappetens]
MTPWLARLFASAAWAASRGWEAARATASLPPTCRQAMAHAALLCSGVEPVYFSAGFGPLSLAWGWLLLGLALGALLRPVLLACVLFAARHAGAAPGPLVRPVRSPQDSAHARADAAVEVLRCVALGGRDELHALAASAGLSPAALAEALATPAPAAPATPTSTQPRRRRNRADTAAR